MEEDLRAFQFKQATSGSGRESAEALLQVKSLTKRVDGTEEELRGVRDEYATKDALAQLTRTLFDQVSFCDCNWVGAKLCAMRHIMFFDIFSF